MYYVPWWAPCPPPPPREEEQQEMSGGGGRRRVRTSARQFELILDFMERHPNLATSQLHSGYTVRDRKREWAQFARFLNSHDHLPAGVHKDADRWRKTWFDWKCNVRAKLRSASGKKSLTPLEERLVAVTGMLHTDDVAAAAAAAAAEERTDGPSYAHTVYEIEDGPPKLSAASSHAVDAEDDDSAESVSPAVHSSTYGESQGEYIVPSVVSAPLRSVLPSGPLVPSDVQSPQAGSRGSVAVKQEVVEDAPWPSSAGSSPRAGETVAREQPHAGGGRKRPAADRARLEVEVLLATKRKLEAEERRAQAEALFYEQEKSRSVALASLHQEERRRAAAKAEVLAEHRNFYVQQQKTEALRRRLMQLEVQRLKRQLGKPALPPE